MFVCSFSLICHVVTCLWIIISGIEGNGLPWLQDKENENDNGFVYLTSLYFTITTITTVGYGDISGSNSWERIFCILVMMIGVIGFSYATGILS